MALTWMHASALGPGVSVPLSDGELRSLVAQDADRGWRAFIDQYTPTLLALIERAGVTDRDEAMELYVLACERLSADDCARLRRHDPGKGALGAWLSVLIRNVVVDWVRSRAGRRRLFKSVKELPALEQRVFELFYWQNLTAAEMVGMLGPGFGSPSLDTVLQALDRVQAVLTERQRIELLAMAARSSRPVSLDAPLDEEDKPLDPPDQSVDPERGLIARQTGQLLEDAIQALPPEDAVIVRLKCVEGLSIKQIKQALHLDELTDGRVAGILATLRTRLRRDSATTGAQT
jgi:DNA-directed RNA polymerase specialized sigma24 family protein